MRIVRKELTILQGEVTTADARGLEPRREHVDVRYILVGPVHLTCTFAGGQQVGPADGVSQITSGGLGIGLHRPLGADNPVQTGKLRVDLRGSVAKNLCAASDERGPTGTIGEDADLDTLAERGTVSYRERHCRMDAPRTRDIRGAVDESEIRARAFHALTHFGRECARCLRSVHVPAT